MTKTVERARPSGTEVLNVPTDPGRLRVASSTAGESSRRREAQRAGVAPKMSEAELRQRVVATQWMPAYPS